MGNLVTNKWKILKSNYIKNFFKSLVPINAPTNKKIAKNHPDTDNDAILEKSAPMLQPPASLAP